jgi:abequosyltransferase
MLNNEPLVSFCIPTYNYGDFIGQCLNSILEQCLGFEDQIEIIIGDSGSTDQTEIVISSFRSKFKRFKYINFIKKNGIDVDLAKTISYANGKYCWLLSSDDCLVEDSIKIVIDLIIKNNPSVVLGNRIICDYDLKVKKMNHSILKFVSTNEIFRLKNKFDRINYLIKSKSIEALFSYMSTIIVLRKDWLIHNNSEEFTFSNYAHVDRLLKILFNDGTLCYLKPPIIYFRGYNDSFAKAGYINRLLIDFEGYYKVINAHFKDESKFIKKIMRREHRYYYLLRVKQEIKSNTEWKTVKKWLNFYEYNFFQVVIINYLGNLSRVIQLLRRVKRILGIL